MEVLEKSITGGINNLYTLLIDYPSTMISKLSDLFVYLFVPSNNVTDHIASLINDKYPFIAQMGSLTKQVVFGDYSETAPTFSINFKGKSLRIIDFTAILPYRPILLTIETFIIVVGFINWLLRFIPSLLSGIGDFGGGGGN